MQLRYKDKVLPGSSSISGGSSNIIFEGSMPFIILQADSWDENNEQIVSIPGVSADESKQIIIPTPASTNQDAFYLAGIRAVSQSTDSITFRCNNIPEEDLTVYVAVMESKGSTDSDLTEAYV